ncbi:MAG: hypothetical protein OK454_01355, partial [Thaumarchaeota archaeon]|nr:hypothetical protein [Nitrososphaerota archaeon]
LQQKASAAEINSVLGNSVDGREVLASIEQNSTTADDAELTVALRELQTNFDSYRNEQTVDRRTMREQMDRLSGEKSSLQAAVSRVSSQLTLATERYEMLHSNFVALQSENQELQKRGQNLSESAARQDIRTQQVAEDLIESRGLLESMRSENANLKAEKTLWKGIQDRLNQDNESLVQDKNRLNGLLATQQSLQNERDLNESETRRRLQTQIDSLDAELKTTKRKLDEEVKEAKQAQLKKDYDAQQSQKRVDDLLASLGQIKEQHASTRTSRDLLQARVDDLTVELRNAEERATRLQPRPTPRPGFAPEQTAAPDEDDAEARLQELTNEASDLKRDLDLANTHLENAKAQAEQFKQLAQTAEEELETLNNAQELYHEEMDSSLATKESRIKELEQRADDLSAELANSNRQLSTLQDSQAEVARRYEDEKRILDEEIARLKDDEERFNETARAHRQDLRAQADIATKAQQDYEQELVKHAEAAQQLQLLRAEYNQLKNDAVSWKTEAESARHALAQSEGSWGERKAHLEQELEDLKRRRDDTNAENKLLHQQLDSVTAQITALKQSRASAGESGESVPAATADAGLEGLNELNGYLRREKEILEVQNELKNQESRRLQTQVEYMQSQLDEARLKLEQERRAQTDSSTAALAHKDLMEKLNQLNLLRESNATLRSEGQRTLKQLAEKAVAIEKLEAKIQPLEAQIRELESQKSFTEEELKQVQEDRDRWQKRMEGILANYGRTDPAEVEQLKQRVTELETERDALRAAEQALQEKANQAQELETTLEAERVQWRDSRTKIIEQAKERDRKKTATINEMQISRNELQTQLDEISTKLAACEQELEAAEQEKATLEAERNS